ncbi:substrate-binding domain-containing protein [Streptomyces sp. NPDC018947]|uniref:substrate-binding domain-containing protein n=1 Tax=Streptomyces sp. NPDC018947 TaxID=3365054 RepID=UPI0037B326AD
MRPAGAARCRSRRVLIKAVAGVARAQPVDEPHAWSRSNADKADLAFQQCSEPTGLPGVGVAPLPGGTAIDSVLGGGVLASSARPDRAREVVDLLGSDAASGIARARGMRAVGPRG